MPAKVQYRLVHRETRVPQLGPRDSLSEILAEVYRRGAAYGAAQGGAAADEKIRDPGHWAQNLDVNVEATTSTPLCGEVVR